MRERACLACEGTGRVYRRVEVSQWAVCVSNGCLDCAACGGTGEVEERIPAADALADAITLIANVRKNRSAVIRTYLRDAELSTDAALDYARGIKPEMDCGLPGTPSEGWKTADLAVYWARLSARAAFRAVPGLRA